MPSLRRDRGNGWWARVILDGRQIACKMFPPGKKGGPEWRAAKEWEEKTLKEAELRLPPTRSGLERLLAWGDAYLRHVARTMKQQTQIEKTTVMKAFFGFCNAQGIDSLEGVTRPLAYQFLSGIADRKGPKSANVYRKNLLASWNWGMDFFEGFPQNSAIIVKIKPFPVTRTHRYVPPEEDVLKVLRLAKGQDLIFLLAAYFTGARIGELLRLSWGDVNFSSGRIRLTDSKGGGGAERERWLPLHPELAKALAWWRETRHCEVDNVFMQEWRGAARGKPYRQRARFMPGLCAAAGVKPFGMHAIRHKSAAITFEAKGLAAAQVLMGHSRATTTDIYVRSAGLYADQSVILEALGKNVIGQAVSGLLAKEMPLEAVKTPEAFCTQRNVHSLY